jgi:hypothetical protein
MSWLSQLFIRKPPTAPNLWSGTVLSAEDFNNAVGNVWPAADESYAVLKADALPAFYVWFRSETDRLGLRPDIGRLDCDDWAHLYRDLLNARWYKAQWEGTSPKAQSAAVAAYWFRLYRSNYLGGNVLPASGHAINVLVTDEGVKYLEPQTGAFVELNQDEVASRFNIIT